MIEEGGRGKDAEAGRTRGTHCVGPGSEAALLSLVAPQALAQSTTTTTPAPASFQSQCGGGGSAQGYPDASPADAADLFTSSFPCLLDSLADDPTDSFSSQASGAQDESGGDAVAGDSAQAPLTTTDASGESVPVDLALEPAGGGFQLVAPLIDLTLPADLGDRVSFGDQGIAIDAGATDPPVAASASARPFADGKGLFYANAAPATDVALAPLRHGLEATYQLRASESPDHLQMGLTLPDGASLEAAGQGGAWIAEGDQVLADVTPPLAFDAAGNPVAAAVTVKGGSLEVDLPESDPSTTYPIAVTTMVTTSSTVAASDRATASTASQFTFNTTPKLGYNVIQLGNPGPDDPNSNFGYAENTGNATWYRGGPGMMEDSFHQDEYVNRARGLQPQPMNVLYVIPRPGMADDKIPLGDPKVPGSTTPAEYGTKCNQYVNLHRNVQAYEIMNEPNTYKYLGQNPDGTPRAATVDRYADYAISCYLGIRDARPNVRVLAASEDLRQMSHDNPRLTYYEWLYEFAQDTRIAAPDLILSLHYYPTLPSELHSPEQAANAMESFIAYDLAFGSWSWDLDRDLWITEMGVYDSDLADNHNLDSDGDACASEYKPNYLSQMFEKAGTNNTYPVPVVDAYRFTRNGTDGYQDAGVFDSNRPFLNGREKCGIDELADAASGG